MGEGLLMVVVQVVVCLCRVIVFLLNAQSNKLDFIGHLSLVDTIIF